MHIYRPAYASQLYAYAYFEPVCAFKLMHTQKHLNPNPKNRQAEKQSRFESLIYQPNMLRKYKESIKLT